MQNRLHRRAMRYVSANDQEDIWDTGRTMASLPAELQLCRQILRVPGYGSLWHPGRGWIALPSPSGELPSSFNSTRFLSMFLQEGSRSQVPYWSSRSYSVEEKAEHLTSLALEKASYIMSAVQGAGTVNSSKWGPVPDAIRQSLESVVMPYDMDHSDPELKKLNGRNILINAARLIARGIDLSEGVYFLGFLESKLSEMRIKLSDMLFMMPSFASCISARPIKEFTGLLSKLEQRGLLHVPSLRGVYRDENEGFFARILGNMIYFLAIRFIKEATSLLGPVMDKRKQDFLSGLLSKSQTALLKGQLLLKYSVAAEKEKGDRLRNDFVARAELEPPPTLRMIDCKATGDEGRVVLKDWKDCDQARGYSAISHTYGQDVYEVFNCTCASICKEAEKPRCSFDTCPHDPAAPNAAHIRQTRVVKDILNMCGILWDAGVRYAWHDGVCIAQHDEAEVRETIEHIGWVYSSGRETIIFLHYVGKPLAPITRFADVLDEIACRWHTRVWTFQEAALSKRRRYCIRTCKNKNGPCESFVDFIRNVDLWYENESSSVEVVEEERFYDILMFFFLNLIGLLVKCSQADLENLSFINMLFVNGLYDCMYHLTETLHSACFGFPTIDDALRLCVERESKHKGDRINSILMLAGVKGLVVPKDSSVEASTLEFFKKQGQKGLARALFAVYLRHRDHDYPAHEVRRHKWLPLLGRGLAYEYKDGLEDGMRLRVLENGRLEVRPGDGDELFCNKVRIVVKPPEADCINYDRGRRVKGPEAQDVQNVLQSLIASARRGHSIVLDMHLALPDPVLLLPQAPSCVLGRISMSLFFYADQKLRVLNPSNIDDEEQRLLEEEESFDAHLLTTSRGGGSRTFLLLHGDDILRGEVSKIGSFFTPFHSHIHELMLASNIRPERVIII